MNCNFGTDYSRVKIKPTEPIQVKENSECVDEPLMTASAARERFAARGLNSPAFFDLGVDYRKPGKTKPPVPLPSVTVEPMFRGSEAFQTVLAGGLSGGQARNVQSVTTTTQRSRVADGKGAIQITHSKTVNGQTRQLQTKTVTVQRSGDVTGRASPRRLFEQLPPAGVSDGCAQAVHSSGPTITVLASEERQTKNEVLPTLTVSTDGSSPLPRSPKGQRSPRAVSPTAVSSGIQKRIEKLQSPTPEKGSRPPFFELKKSSPRNSKVICYGHSGAPTSPKGHAAQPKAFQAAKRKSLEVMWGETLTAQGKTSVSGHKMTSSAMTGTLSVSSAEPSSVSPLSSRSGQSSPRPGSPQTTTLLDSSFTNTKSKSRTDSPKLISKDFQSRPQLFTPMDGDNRSDADKVLSKRANSPFYSKKKTSVVMETKSQSNVKWQTVSSTSTVSPNQPEARIGSAAWQDEEYDDVIVDTSRPASRVSVTSSQGSLLSSVHRTSEVTDFGDDLYSEKITQARAFLGRHETNTTEADDIYETLVDTEIPVDDEDDEYATDDSGYEHVSNQQPSGESRWNNLPSSAAKKGRTSSRKPRDRSRRGNVTRGVKSSSHPGLVKQENENTPPLPPRMEHAQTRLRKSRDSADDGLLNTSHMMTYMTSSSRSASATMGYQRKTQTLSNDSRLSDMETFSVSASHSSSQHINISSNDPTSISLFQDDWGGESSTDAKPLFKRTSFRAFQTKELYQVYHCNTVALNALSKHSLRLDGPDDDGRLLAIEGPGSPDSPTMDNRDCQEPNQILTTYENLKDMNGEVSLDQIKKNLYSVIKSSAGYRTLWCEMPEVVESGVLGKMTDKDKRFQETLFEIITSEASYFKSIDVLIVNFQEDMTLGEVLHDQDKKDLFSNIKAIKDASQSFLKHMEEKWNNDFRLSCDLCDIVREFCVSKFDSYIVYLAAQHLQERKLTELLEKNNAFKEVLYRIQQRTECKKLPLQSFLSLPFQRITRFPLLMKSVMEQLDGQDEDHVRAMRAFDVGRELVEKCNSRAKQWQTLEEISRIEKSLDFKNCKRIGVVSKNRYLEKKGPLTRIVQSATLLAKKSETCFLFVFNDIIIITKKKTKDKGDRYEVHDHGWKKDVGVALMNDTQVAERLKTSLSVKGGRNLLVLTMPGVPSVNYIFTSDSETDLTRWKDSLTVEPMDDQKEKIYGEIGCPRMEVLHRYMARDPDEMDLQESDVLDVYRKMNDGWYEGYNTRSGQRGWFPSNYCLPIDDTKQAGGRVVTEKYKVLSKARRQLPTPGCESETAS